MVETQKEKAPSKQSTASSTIMMSNHNSSATAAATSAQQHSSSHHTQMMPTVSPNNAGGGMTTASDSMFQFNDNTGTQTGKKMGDSGRNHHHGGGGHGGGGGKGDQGEIRIKYTDSAKVEQGQMFFRDPGFNRPEQVDIKVNFAMAYGDTQNFSVPIYSGNFAFRVTFTKKTGQEEAEASLDVIHNSCHVDQTLDPRKAEKVNQNLKTIIEKAIRLQIRKIQYKQENFFKLDGNIKSIFHTREASTAMLRLKIQDTHAHQSTVQAKSHFAEFGISTQINNAQTTKILNEKNNKDVNTYPSQNFGHITFAEQLVCYFTMTQEIWHQQDEQFNQTYEQLKKLNEEKFIQIANGQMQVQDTQAESKIKYSDMAHLDQLKRAEQNQNTLTREYRFNTSGQLKLFLQQYEMNIERCLRAMAMDPSCTNGCFEKPIHKFGKGCKDRCDQNSQRTFTFTERYVILFSMLYVSKDQLKNRKEDDQQTFEQDCDNLRPDIREQLWLRASGAPQLMKSYSGYQVGQMKKDYYTALEESPCPPNPSIGTIKADQSRIAFDLEYTEKNSNIHVKGILDTKGMQKRFADVMTTYHKRNGSFIYNQSQSEILIRILEVVFKKETAFWLYTILNETILPLNFYTNTLYPQAFLKYTVNLVQDKDSGFFEKSGDAIKMFCLKSYYSLFTNLTTDQHATLGKSEMAYFMLDLLFLLGDPKVSTTILEDAQDGNFTVGENIPQQVFKKDKKIKYNGDETKVRIDKTSQLLISMSITIAEIVKKEYMRGHDKKKDMEDQIRQLSGFEKIVRECRIDKSAFLDQILTIECFFFSKKSNQSPNDSNFDIQFNRSAQRMNQVEQETQIDKWLKNNDSFGKALDKIKVQTDCRFDKGPRIKTNIENGQRYLDKAKFLTKFSCFDGYMQYVDTKYQNQDIMGINYEEFKDSLQREIETSNRQSLRSNFYNNYLTEEWLVSQTQCGGHQHQPICLYDFTVKKLSHDCLYFSTRHMTPQNHIRYIDNAYVKVQQSTCPYNANQYQVAAGSKSLSRPMAKGELNYQSASQNLLQSFEEIKAPDADIYDNSRSRKLNAHEHYLHLNSLEKLPLPFDKAKIPVSLPIQRGIHLCNDNFVKIFKHAYNEESSTLATKYQQNIQPSSMNNRVSSLLQNRLFNQKMIEMLYAREIIQSSIKIEGSFSNARAMAQLRQFYMRIIDPEDIHGLQCLWENKRLKYSTEVVEEAMKSNGRTSNQSANLTGSTDLDGIEDLVKAQTRLHSDLTFLHWPQWFMNRSQVNVYKETGGGSRGDAKKPFKMVMSRIPYRHLMIADDQDSMPFADLQIEDPATAVSETPEGEQQQNAASQYTPEDEQNATSKGGYPPQQQLDTTSSKQSLVNPQDTIPQQAQADEDEQQELHQQKRNNSSLLDHDYINKLSCDEEAPQLQRMNLLQIEKDAQAYYTIQCLHKQDAQTLNLQQQIVMEAEEEESKTAAAEKELLQISQRQQQMYHPDGQPPNQLQNVDMIDLIGNDVISESLQQKRDSLERSMMTYIQAPAHQSGEESAEYNRNFQDRHHRDSMWPLDNNNQPQQTYGNIGNNYNGKAEPGSHESEPLVNGLGVSASSSRRQSSIDSPLDVVDVDSNSQNTFQRAESQEENKFDPTLRAQNPQGRQAEILKKRPSQLFIDNHK